MKQEDAHTKELRVLSDAVLEAKRFIAKAEKFARSESDQVSPSRSRAAALRASLDLSSALSAFRRFRSDFYSSRGGM